MSFSIRSTHSDRELVFTDLQPDYFTVELRGSSASSTRRVYIYPGARDLATFFSFLATHGRPWEGVESWASPEGEFKLSAKCSNVGHVSFFIDIQEKFGGPEQWQVTAELASEMGQLPAIAKEATSFFNVVHSA